MKKLSFIIIATLTMFACKKESEPTLIEELAKSNWKKTQILISLDSITANPSDTIPVTVVIPGDCKKDNIWSFNAINNTFTLDEGATKCGISDPQIKDQGAITDINNGSQLKVEGTGTNEIWNIESRSATSFRVSYFAKNSDNVTVKFRVTFIKI